MNKYLERHIVKNKGCENGCGAGLLVQVKKYFGIKMGVKTPLSASQFHYSVSICDNFSLKPYFVSSISENELSRILKKFVFRIRCISSNECAQISQILQSSLWIRSCFENVFLKKQVSFSRHIIYILDDLFIGFGLQNLLSSLQSQICLILWESTGLLASGPVGIQNLKVLLKQYKQIIKMIYYLYVRLYNNKNLFQKSISVFQRLYFLYYSLQEKCTFV